MSTNCSTAPVTARTAGAPELMRFSAAASQARSCARVAVAASTSDAAPVAWAARSRRRVATAVAAAAKRAASAGTVGFGHVAGPLVVESGQPAGPDHRRVRNAGDHRHTTQNGARRVLDGPLVGRK